jgi:hypothetical protein
MSTEPLQRLAPRAVRQKTTFVGRPGDTVGK